VRAREAAKKDQLRRRHRLGEFPLRHHHRLTDAVKAWTKKYMDWIQAHVGFAQLALEATLAHDLHEVEHATEQILQLEQAIRRCGNIPAAIVFNEVRSSGRVTRI